MNSKTLHCPICKSPVQLLADGKWPDAFPFCCERCKLIDLGAWAKEEYRMPAENQSDDDTGNDSKTTVKTGHQSCRKIKDRTSISVN